MKSVKGCVKCGACAPVCPVFRVTGRESFTARGRNQILDVLSPSERSRVFAEIFSKCLLCGACRDICPRDVDTPKRIVAARAEFSALSGHSFVQKLARKAMASPRFLTGIAAAGGVLSRLLGSRIPEDSGLRLRLASVDPALVEPAHKNYLESLPVERTDKKSVGPDGVHYFTGCLANFLQPEIAHATDELVACCDIAPATVAKEQVCCGMAAYGSGSVEEAKRLARKNIAAFAGDSRPILTSCASCFAHLSTYPELLAEDEKWADAARDFADRLQEFSSFFEKKLPHAQWAQSEKEVPTSEKRRVLYHDPCHLRFGHRIMDEPRRLLAMVPEVRLVELGDGPQCCGQGGFFQLAHPELSRAIRDRILADFTETSAEIVVTTCSGCLLQWRQGLSKEKAEHLAVLLARFFVNRNCD